MTNETTVNLFVEERNGKPIFENVLVEQIGNGRYLLLRSPGLLSGLAAEDEFELTADEPQGFRLVKRSGNVCVQIFLVCGLSKLGDDFEQKVVELGGQIDGENDSETSSVVVLTFHVSVGFGRIEDFMHSVLSRFPDTEWYYGNVYDPKDGVTPLNWWVTE